MTEIQEVLACHLNNFVVVVGKIDVGHWDNYRTASIDQRETYSHRDTIHSHWVTNIHKTHTS